MALNRRKVLFGATACVAGVGGVAATIPIFGQFNPASDAVAMQGVLVDLAEISVGAFKRVVGPDAKPVFIRHRTPEQIATVMKREQEIDTLEPDENRLFEFEGRKDPRYIILRAGCPRFGCALTPETTDTIGWRCSCDNFEYDYSGRLLNMSGLNMKLPFGRYLSPTIFELTSQPVPSFDL